LYGAVSHVQCFVVLHGAALATSSYPNQVP
jgi:hypothetical protein